jgi:acyl carrier protein
MSEQSVPRGVEVLLRKASVDPQFKKLLLQDYAAAADSIGLALAPGEAEMLSAAPAGQLEAIIARTTVPQEHRRAFLGQAAAAMLAIVGAAASVLAEEPRVAPSEGIRPNPKKTVTERVKEIVARRLQKNIKDLRTEDSLTKDLGAKPETLTTIREDLAKEFNIKVPAEEFKKLDTVADIAIFVEKALELKKPPPPTQGIRPDMPPATKGIRPDLPPDSRGIQPELPPPASGEL